MSTVIIDKSPLKRNNLVNSSSPYLLQHTSNPVWWQEWSREVLEYALSEKKPLLVSVGYATCHWCHVMASEAFSDSATTDFLNSNFVCIKVDREQRPDIDQAMALWVYSLGYSVIRKVDYKIFLNYSGMEKVSDIRHLTE